MALQRPPPPPSSWVYAYELLPPQSPERLHALRHVLDRERAQAAREARTWQGRLIVEHQVTHILIVSDSPELDTGAGQRLEAELQRLDAGFAVTAPLPVGDDLPLAGHQRAGATGAHAQDERSGG